MKWVIVGGGVSVVAFADRLAACEALPDRGRSHHLVLTARTPAPRSVLAHAIETRWRQTGWRATSSSMPGVAALDGADVVILMPRFGGLAGRAHDEALARTFGFVGDEGLGPGGFCNAWRSAPELSHWADAIRERAPRATILNLMAPLTWSTRWLRHEGLEAWGICELPSVTRQALQPLTPSSLSYHGVNHLGWFCPLGTSGRETLRRAVQRGRVDPVVLRTMGGAPLKYVESVASPHVGRRRGTHLPADRATALRHWSRRALDMATRCPHRMTSILSERSMPWFDEALVPMARATAGGEAWDGFLTATTDRGPGWSRPGQAIERQVQWSRSSTRWINPPPPPPPIARFLQAVAESEEQLFQATLHRRVESLALALEALPFERARPIEPAVIARAIAASPAARSLAAASP